LATLQNRQRRFTRRILVSEIVRLAWICYHPARAAWGGAVIGEYEMKHFFLATAVSIFATTAIADPLPKDAKPVAAKSLIKIYAGKTADWSTSKAFFAADGTIKGINTSNGTSIYWGKWTAKGNEVCMVNSWKDTGTGKTGDGAKDCWKWWQAADGTLWQLWSVHYDGSKPSKTDYYTGEEANLKKGDLVSKKFDKLNSM
jgi:hypothetical protein